MDMIDFICKYDKEGIVKSEILQLIKTNFQNKNLNTDELLFDIAEHITTEIECMVDEDYELSSGYGSNVESDIRNKIIKILKNVFQ